MNEIQAQAQQQAAEKFYTIQQVADMLQYSPNTIKRRISDGTIQVVRSNGNRGHIRISQGEFNRFVAGEQQARK